MFNRNGQVEPFAGRGPTNVELSLRRLHQIVWIIVNRVVKFCVGRVNALFHAKLVEIRPIGRVESPAAVVGCIRIVIGHAFAAEIIRADATSAS